MLFSSWEFLLCFLPVVLLGFLLLPGRWRVVRKAWLCLASLVFYAWWRLEYVPLLLASIGVNYALAEWIARRNGDQKSRRVVVLAVVLNLGVLGFCKYTHFFLQSLGWLTHHQITAPSLLLPLAISFYTFTQIGYVVDVARDARLHYSFLDYLLFVLFFPHLIAGPIVRHWEIIPQYAGRDIRVARTDLGAGLALFLLGLYKKTLLADPAAVYADAIYSQAAEGAVLPLLAAWAGTVAYALQIYFDFSGYSDMAIGLARMFSIKFPANFDSPYQAGNIAEFWRRWHMSLTRFLREYVYFPLGGSRRGLAVQLRNVMITFLLSGLWHGAGWTYVLWGGLHGCYLGIFVLWGKFKQRLNWNTESLPWRLAGVALTFIAVMFAWVCFRSPTLEVAGRTMMSMLGGNGFDFPEKDQWLCNALQTVAPATVVDKWSRVLRHLGFLLAIVWLMPNTQQLLSRFEMVLDGSPRPARWRLSLHAGTGFVLGLLFLLFVYSRYNAAASPFLYFNF